ncbi:MAG: hypothetical protein LBE31_05980, partial [Deltaproteobacteria bacterium]|nr:hypothetical protein [Deltaproteobacteria bacterium]
MGVSISKLDPVKPLKVKSKLKKLKRFFIFFFLALILILSASIAFIRTDRGLNFVASKGASFLSSMGLKATWDKIEGPFPQKIVLSGLRLTDNLGEFLTAKQIHLEASPWKLLSREIKIDILEISGLDFKRRPIVPPPKPSSSSPAPKIFLNAKVIVTDSRLSPAVILPPGLNSSQDDIPIDSANNLFSPNSDITLDTYPPEQGRLSLRADLKFERGVLDFDFDFSWDDSPALTQGASNNGLYGLYGQGKLLQRYPANPDTLDFKVVAHNGPGGTLSLLMGQPDLPAWTLSLSGSGPVSSWSGNASMGLDLEQTGLAEASLNLSLPNGSVLKDLVEDPQLKLSLEAQGGPQAPLPEALIARLGQGLALNANLNLKEDSLYGFLTVLFPKAQLSVNSFKATNLKNNVNLMAAGVIAFDPAITLPAESSQNSEANQSENPLDSFLASAFDLALERRDDQFLIESFNLVSQGFSLKSSGLFKPVSLDSQASQVSQVSQDSQAGQVSQASDASDLSQALSQIEAKIELQTAQDSPWQKLFELVLNGPTLGDSSLSASLSWPKNDHLDLSAHFTAQNLGTLVSGWQGQIEADIAAKGPIDNLTSEIDLLSPALVGPFGQEFVDLTCDLRLLVSNLPDPPKALGTLSAAIKEKAGSPFEAKASLEVAPGPPFKAKVSDLKLQADSGKRLDLESPSLSLSLGAPFDIEGTVNLTINDWKTISEFTGLPITGAPAHLEASFLRDPKNNLSTATAKVEMPDFKFQNISLSDLKLNMLAEGLTDNPNLDLNMTLGPGRFSDISFSQGNLKAQAKDSQGSFSLDLKSTDAYELAHASGEIDLADKIINLVTLRADLPELPDKIALSKPAKISLDPLAIDDLHLIYGQKATISGSFNRQ